MNDGIHDIRERNVTVRSEIWTTNICRLGFQDIMEVDIKEFGVYLVSLIPLCVAQFTNCIHPCGVTNIKCKPNIICHSLYNVIVILIH